MRVIWNAGAALVVTAILTSVTCLGSSPPVLVPARSSVASVSGGDLSHRRYASLAEHFEAANSAHDGKLTPAEARLNGWSRIVKHFDEIDSNRLGYVTQDQIHAYNISHHHNLRLAQFP